MEIKANRAEPSDARSIGKYFHTLLTERKRWIRRRVDRIVSISTDYDEIRTSYDLDLDFIQEVARDSNVRVNGRVLVPLNSFKKSTLLDIDARDGGGKALHVLKAPENNFLTHAAFLASVSKEVGYWKMRKNYQPELYSLGFGVDEVDDADRYHVQELVSASLSSRHDDSDPELWPTFDEYDFVIAVPVNSDVEDSGLYLVKTRQIAARHRGKWWASLGAFSQLRLEERRYEIPLPELRGNLHLKVELPDELRIHSVDILPDPNTVGSGEDSGFKSTKEYQSLLPPPPDLFSISGSFATFHDRGKDTGRLLDFAAEFRVRFALRMLAVFPMAFLSLLVVAALYCVRNLDEWLNTWKYAPWPVAQDATIVGRAGESMATIVSEAANNGAIVTVFAILPTVIVIYLFREGEHFLVTRALWTCRAAMVVSAATLILFGGMVAVGMPKTTMLSLVDILLSVAVTCFAIHLIALFQSIKTTYLYRQLQLRIMERLTFQLAVLGGFVFSPIFSRRQASR